MSTKLSGLRLLYLVAALSALSHGNAAIADESLAPGESIMDRSRPELDALGLPLGALRLFPSLNLSAEHNSNIFANNTVEVSDWIVSVSPYARLASDWGRHAVEASVGATIARYQENRQEDFEDVSVTGNLDFDMSTASALRFSAQYDSGHEDRFSPDDVLGVEPTSYAQERLSAAYVRRVGRLSLRFGATRTSIDFDDVIGASGTVNNDDRDRTNSDVSIRAGYEVQPGFDVFVRADRGENDYDAAVDDNGVNRDSENSSLAIGLRGAVSGSTYLEAFVGYTEHDYDTGTLADVDSPWYDGRLVWNVSGLTTLTLEARRDVRQTTFNMASGYTATRVGISADHELLRNLLLHASVYTQKDDYIGIDRDDENTLIAISARYLMNRHFQVSLEFRERERDSLVGGSNADDFSTGTVLLSIRAQR